MANAKCIRLGGQILDVGAGRSIYDALIALANNSGGASIDVVDTDDIVMNLTGNGLASDPYELSATLGNRASVLRVSQSATIAPVTNTDIVFQSVDINGDFSYNTTTGVITFAKSGKYLMQGIVGFQSSQAWDANTAGQSVYARATAMHNANVVLVGFVPIPSGANYGVETLIDLSGAITVVDGDTLKFSVQHNATGKVLHPSSCFVSIEKVG